MATNSRVAVVVLGVLLAALLVLVGGLAALDGGGTLTEQWVSDTSRTLQQNHHPVAAAGAGEDAILVAPVNEFGDADHLTDTSCALVRLDPATGGTVWRVGVPPANCTNHALTGPAITDLDGDGTAEVVAATGEHTLDAYDAETGEREWRVPLSTLGYGEPVAADLLPADGLEVVVADVNGNVAVVYANGTTAWRGNHSTSAWATPAVADFDGDGDPEVAIGTWNEIVLYEADGERAWRTNRSARWFATGQADGDARPELFVASQDEVFALDGDDGAVVWSRGLDQVTALHEVADVDGDGTDEVFLGLSGGTVAALDANDGSESWRTDLPGDNRVGPPPVLGDLDGDGDPELVAVAQEGGIYVLDPATGDELAASERETPIWTHPTLVDVSGDGTDDVVVIYGDGRVGAFTYESP